MREKAKVFEKSTVTTQSFLWWTNFFNCTVFIYFLKLHYIYFNFSLFLFIYFYCCSSTVISIFPSPLPTAHTSPHPTLDPSPLWLCPCVLYTCSLMTLPLFPLVIPSRLGTNWLLSVCSLFQCLWLYFAFLINLISNWKRLYLNDHQFLQWTFMASVLGSVSNFFLWHTTRKIIIV